MKIGYFCIMKYPCDKCGCCCKNVGIIIQHIKEQQNYAFYFVDFPYKIDESGRCEKLSIENKCTVYSERPIICRVNKIAKLSGINEKKFFEMNKKVCRAIQTSQK
jgi:Fe-S-cluster containining protein